MAFEDSQDVNFAARKLVDDAIIAMDEFSDIVIVQLWDAAPQPPRG